MGSNKISNEAIDFEIIVNLSHDEFIKFILNKSQSQSQEEKRNFLNKLLLYFKENYIGKRQGSSEHIATLSENLKNNFYFLSECLSFNKENCFKYENISLNEELRNEIFSDMPSSLSETEKALYIYIKLCKVLSYDEEFFSYLMIGKFRKLRESVHSNIEHLKLVKPGDTIVCWEFLTIYGKLLTEQGIENYMYEVIWDYVHHFVVLSESEFFDVRYGEWHPSFAIKINNEILSVDFKAIFSDLSYAKMNYKLNGITNLHGEHYWEIDKGRPLSEDISSLVIKIYQMIDKNYSMQTYDFNSVLNQYRQEYLNTTNISINEKMEILTDLITKTQLSRMDLYDYILLLRKNIFNEQERTDNFKIILVSDLEQVNLGKTASCVAVFVINDKSITQNPEHNKYFIYSKNKGLYPIEKDVLQDKITEDDYQYFMETSEIPGITR